MGLYRPIFAQNRSHVDSPTGSFTLATNAPPTADVTVPLTTNGQCAVSPTDVILPAGSTAPQVVTVTIVDDLVVEASPHPCAITTGDPTSGDGFYDGLDAADVADTSVDVLDNDTAGITLDDSALTTLDEATVATNTSFTLAADTPPTADVTVPLTTNGECTVNPTSVILPANSTAAQVVTVTVVDDLVVEASPHPCAITTGDPTSGDGFYDALAAADVADTSVDVLDDDMVPTEPTPEPIPAPVEPEPVAPAPSGDPVPLEPEDLGVTELPSTGETPAWRTPLILAVGLGTLLTLLGGAWILRRR